jgi:hypothetical protein
LPWIALPFVRRSKINETAETVNASFHRDGILNANPEEVAKRFRAFGINETGRAIAYQAQSIKVINQKGTWDVPIKGGKTFLTVAGDIINSRAAIRLINFDYREGKITQDCDGWAYANNLDNPVELIKIQPSEIKIV